MKKATLPAAPTDELIYIEGAAVMLGGTTVRAVRARCNRGLLPHRKLGKRIVFLRSELLQFIRDLPGVSLAEAKENLVIRNGEVRQ